jgi:putative ubiquitin-RnfH superfamily antitoxin RatB of RatAB toxin-antitoxin module
MAKAESTALLKVSLVYSPAPRQVRQWALELAGSTTVAQALAASGILKEFPELQVGRPALGIWGKKTTPGHVLQEGDRLEIYRGLRVDPKVARRERFNRQGVKRAGLFAKTRTGAKAGY